MKQNMFTFCRIFAFVLFCFSCNVLVTFLWHLLSFISNAGIHIELMFLTDDKCHKGTKFYLWKSQLVSITDHDGW